jgi:AraC-like DNA-binding protein
MNPDFAVEIFSREMGMSRTNLHRKLKALTDCSATEFIRVFRLKSQ